MELYYRLVERGALVFRLDVSNRQRRIELTQIATIDAQGDVRPNGRPDVRPNGRQPATHDELASASAWWCDWQARRAKGHLTETECFRAEINRFTEWMAREARDDEISRLSDPLLMALLDLRQVVVRRLSEIEADRELASGSKGLR
jgi:hypothetical protein